MLIIVSQIYPSELQLNKVNTSDTEDTDAAFLDLHLSISNDIVSTKNYDKSDDFDFESHGQNLDLHLSISNDIVSTRNYDKRDDFDFESHGQFPIYRQ